jgi:hypothetical protein
MTRYIVSRVRTNVFCRRRARRVRYCDRSEASRMSRFRYICGGALGRSDVGSVMEEFRGCLSVDMRSFASWDVSTRVDVYGGGCAWAAAATALTDVCGAGAPLTI